MGFWNFLKSIANTIKSAISSRIEEAETRTDEIKVKDVKICSRFVFEGDSVYVYNDDCIKELNKDNTDFVICLTRDAKFEIDIKRFTRLNNESEKKWYNARLYVVFKKGFKTDGTSAPKFFQNILPSCRAMDDDSSQVYNLAAFVHDGLYACNGEIKEKGAPGNESVERRCKLTRHECDNILADLWTKSGLVSDLTANLAEVGVNLAAGGKEHWNNDSYKCRDDFSVEIEYLGE